MKSRSVGAKFEVFGHILEGFGEVLGSFWSLEGTIWEVGRDLGHKCARKGGRGNSPSPLLARKMPPGSSPGGAQRTRKSAEKTPKKETRGYVKRK